MLVVVILVDGGEIGGVVVVVEATGVEGIVVVERVGGILLMLGRTFRRLQSVLVIVVLDCYNWVWKV